MRQIWSKIFYCKLRPETLETQALGPITLELLIMKTEMSKEKLHHPQEARTASWIDLLEPLKNSIQWQIKSRLSPEAKARIKKLLDYFYPAVPGKLPVVRKNAVKWSLDGDKPLISVVIPCYNYGHYLGEALDSVAHQTFQDLEVIVVDDGSTDPYTSEVLDQLCRPKVKVIRQKNTGLPGARNTGIEKARGKYICCLDADDVLEPTYLEKCVAVLESNPGIGLAYSWLRLFGDEEGFWETLDLDILRILQYNHVSVSAVYRKEDWTAVGGYRDEMLGGYEDWELWMRMAGHGLRGKSIPEPLLGHRRHGKTMTHEANAMAIELQQRMKRLNTDLFAQHRKRHKLRQNYHDIRLDRPFFNMDDSRHYLTGTKGRSLLALAPWLELGGADIVLQQVLKSLSKEWDIHVVTCVPSRNPLDKDIRNITPYIYHLPNFLNEEDYRPFLMNFITTRSVQAIFLDGSELGYTSLPGIKKNHPSVRVVNILHNDSHLGHFRSALLRMDDIDLFVAINERIRDGLVRNGVAPHKIEVIFNGVDTEGVFNPTYQDREALRQRWNIPRDSFVLLFAGRLSEEKRPLLFLKIAEQLLDEPRARFMLVGDGVLRRQIEKLLDKSPLSSRLTWLPMVPPREMAGIYAAADALLLPSAVEGLPMVMLEALSMEVPVFATDAGEIRRVVHSGLNGYVVPVEKPMDLVEPLRQMMRAPKAELKTFRENARKSVIEGGYSLERASKQYEEIFSKLHEN